MLPKEESVNTEIHTLELFFIDGRPDGMLTAEVFGWTGHVLVTPRTQLPEALNRKEARHTGVYLLIGETENGGSQAYIGEAEDIGRRIKKQDADKDWWSSAVLITTTGNTLHVAHAKYLEARLVEISRGVNKIALENGNTPSRPSLQEAVQANMETFLKNILMVLPALRIDFLLAHTRESSAQITKATEELPAPVFELVTPLHGLEATARLVDGEFIVEKGSDARGRWAGQGSESSSYARLTAELIQQQVLVPEGEKAVFAQDYAFSSPSAAAAVVNGRPTNGTTAWKLRDSDMTYKDWEADRLTAEEA